MNLYPPALARLIEDLAKLPGVGKKSAQRLAFYILDKGEAEGRELACAIVELAEKIHYCPVCFNIAEGEVCAVCADEKRDRSLICVVESARDILPLEKSGSYRGLYHVLGGVLSPLEGVGPKELHLKELLLRLEDGSVREVILATGSQVEGEATAGYLAELMKPFELRVSRIAQGLPVGGDLEYVDEITLARALEGRRDM